jgi:hypothetical protein
MEQHEIDPTTRMTYEAQIRLYIVSNLGDVPLVLFVREAADRLEKLPVVDGGIAVDAFDDGTGIRNATWRSHVQRPGRPLPRLQPATRPRFRVDRHGLLDDPAYIAGAGSGVQPRRQNVALLSVSVSASLLAQFVSLIAAPGGEGDPGPLQYALSTHTLEHLPCESKAHCAFENAAGVGDRRSPLTGEHPAACAQIASRRRWWRRALRLARPPAHPHRSDEVEPAKL